MSLFDWLLVLHLIGDFLLQTHHQAINKMKGKFFNWPLVSHCLVYTLVFLPLVLLCKMAPGWLGVLLVSHLILDRRTVVAWWVRRIKKKDAEESFWLTIVIDQIFHLLILVAIAVIGG